MQRQIKQARQQQNAVIQDLNRDVAKYMLMGGKAPIEITKAFEKVVKRRPEHQLSPGDMIVIAGQILPQTRKRRTL